MRTLLALAIVFAPLTARAEDDLVKAYVANVATAPAKADAATKDCTLAVLPTGEVRKAGGGIRVKDLLGVDVKDVTLVATKVTHGDLKSTSMAEWFDAEVEARVGKKVIDRLRVVGIGSYHQPDLDRYDILLAHWSKPISDKDARKLAAATAPAIKDETAPGPANDEDYEQLMQMLKPGGDNIGPTLADGIKRWNMVVFGSSPRERYQGAKGAAAVKGWKIKLSSSGGTYKAKAGEYCGVTHFTGTTTTKPAVTIPYVGVVCERYFSASGAPATSPAFASFAVPH